MVDIKRIVLGIVLFLVFWAFQVGYAEPAGTAAWFIGAVIFVILLSVWGKLWMPKPPAEMKKLWMFAIAFGLIATFFISFLGPYVGAVFPPGFTPALLTPLVLSFWLIVFGGAMFVTGWMAKDGITTLIGVIWVFSALHFVTAVGTGPNSYLHFALVVGLSAIVEGLVSKK